MVEYYFSMRQFRLIKCSLFIHSTTTYINLRIDYQIEPRFSDWAKTQSILILVFVGWTVELLVSSWAGACFCVAIKIWLDVRYSTFNIQILNVEYRISNSIQHSNRMLNIEYQTKSNIQIECRISNIKLNLTFKFWMSNIEYQTKSNIQIECRISNIKLNPTFKSNVEYRISN